MITVVMPSIPPRDSLRARAIASVNAQEMPPEDLIVEFDGNKEGAAITRQRGLEKVTTEWVAFLDDDDEFKPFHLAVLYAAAITSNADFVYSWYEVVGGIDPRPEEFGLPWDREHPRQTTITTLARTELALAVGGFVDDGDLNLTSPDRHYAGEDWRFTKRMNEAGKIVHVPVKTWLWHHHGANTSGLPNRWKK